MNYKEILEYILQLDESIIIIRGFGDIISNSKLKISNSYMFNNFNKDNYWIIMGRGSDEMILDAMSYIKCKVDVEGEYEFKAILKWIPGDYDERGFPIFRDYLEVEYIDFNFIQTFKQRERQEKLDLVLSKEI